MFINITDKKEVQNKGSSAILVHYLEKENRNLDVRKPEPWFNGSGKVFSPHEVYSRIDANVAKLGRNDPKFFLINISPSQKEIAFLLERFGEDGAREQLKHFAGRVMDEYARNFKRDGISSAANLLWFGKLENHRYYSHGDREVKNGKLERGERKEGSQMHIQVIVSRKDITNRIKLSPQNTSRGKNAEHSKKMGQFDRLAFKQNGETVFDELFGFDRQLGDSFAYAKAQKLGSLEEREALLVASISTGSSERPVVAGVDRLVEITKEEAFLEVLEADLAGTLDDFSLDISDDIDDEAILGRNRHRKKKARTNTR